MKDKEDLLKFNMGQLELLGYGSHEISKIDFKKNLYIFKTSSASASSFKNLFGLQKLSKDVYLSGMWAGALEAISGENVVCIETSCVAKGNQYCEFITKSAASWDKATKTKNKYLFNSTQEKKMLDKWKIIWQR